MNHCPCYGCGKQLHPDDMNTIDVDRYGEHYTEDVCDECMNEAKNQQKQSKLSFEIREENA
jgi:hypothetical protein